jgi:hypothetical protein
MLRRAVALRIRFQNGMVAAWARHGHGMRTAWARHGHGMGTAWARHGHGMGTAWARHGMCESKTAALCKSNEKDTIYTLSGTAWQGNGMVCVN